MSSEHCAALDETTCLFHGNVMPLSLITQDAAQRHLNLLRGALPRIQNPLDATVQQLEIEAAQVVVDASETALPALYAEREQLRDAGNTAWYWVEARIQAARDYRDRALTMQATQHFLGITGPQLRDVERLFSLTGVRVEHVSGSTLVVKVPLDYTPDSLKPQAHLSDMADVNDRRELVRLRERVGDQLIRAREYTSSEALLDIYDAGLTVEDDRDGVTLLVNRADGTLAFTLRFEHNGLLARFVTSRGAHTITSVPQFRARLQTLR